MADEIPSILSHVSIGTNDFRRAVAFYDRVLPTLGCKRIMEHRLAAVFVSKSLEQDRMTDVIEEIGRNDPNIPIVLVDHAGSA